MPALARPNDQPVSIERAMIGSTRTCRIFAGLFIGRGSSLTGTLPELSFCPIRVKGAKNRQNSETMREKTDFLNECEGKSVIIFTLSDKKQAN